MDEAERDQRRLYFDTVAERYSAMRPGYPAPLFDTIVDLAGLAAGDPIIEIGAGTGIATLPLAERGLAITAAEPGPALRAICRQRLAGFPDVDFFAGRFEDMPLPPAPGARAIACGQAFHWIDPTQRFALTHRALRPGGWLMTFWNYELLASPLHQLVQPVYEAVFGPGEPPSVEQRIARHVAAVEEDAAAWFAAPVVRRFPWRQTYTGPELAALHLTYSENATLPAAQLRRLREGFVEVIGEAPGGAVEMRCETVLVAAQRRD